MYLIQLTKEYPDLATMEAVSILGKPHKKISNFMIYDSISGCEKLAYVKKVYRILFETETNLLKKIEEFDWSNVIKKDFYVSKENVEHSQEELADAIWSTLKNPKSNIKNPQAKIHFVKVGRAYFALENLYENTESFNDRKNHYLENSAPISLHPRIARAAINLSGLKKGKIYDPFCGTGGILIEAGLLGHTLAGTDIDNRMVNATIKNLDSFELKGEITQEDAFKFKKKVDAIITDIPYGKNTREKNTDNLFYTYLNHAKNLSKTVVIMLPTFVDISKIKGWKVSFNYEIYIHKSLSKRILLLKKINNS